MNVSRMLQKKKKSLISVDTVTGHTINFHPEKNGQRKISGTLADGTKVHSPLLTCTKHGVTSIAAADGALSLKDMKLARKAIQVLSGKLDAKLRKK